eukprot:CAMPEP_0114276012 /NCGR_PEP_ID=MMETSP0059-20121206/8_1 /TAXON_ID=36894 /ORGANISM="Pyramimonas parkeae, Strain CCMP726" /LENGTH=49 /DNA_ID=CAMNT_0001395979 /DNA_START=294 /DNA_END=446 /DNA_ORIENTATION=+
MNMHYGHSGGTHVCNPSREPVCFPSSQVNLYLHIRSGNAMNTFSDTHAS